MNAEQINAQTEKEQVESAREAYRQELMGNFNPQKLMVIRKELFPSPRDPAVHSGMEISPLMQPAYIVRLDHQVSL